ncbi:MAG: hypothetical protein VB954_07830 [Thalassolituus sp.]
MRFFVGGSAHTIFLYFYNDAIWGGATLVASAEDYSNAAEITLEIQYRDASNELVYKRLTKTLADLVVQGEDQIKSVAAVTTLAYLISGQASCDDVLASGLYADEVDQPLFMAYKTHIAHYCSL